MVASDRRRNLTPFGLLTLLLVGATGCASTGSLATPSTPAVDGLVQLDEQPFDLRATLRSHDATVLVWWASRCTCVVRYRDRIEALLKTWPPDRVAVLAVSSNADDELDQLRAAVAEGRTSLPLVIDPKARLADHVGVRSTPTVVVLDRNGVLRYVGWIDNEREPGDEGRVAYVNEAVNALLAGESPRRASPVYGCSITKTLSSVGRCAKPPSRK